MTKELFTQYGERFLKDDKFNLIAGEIAKAIPEDDAAELVDLIINDEVLCPNLGGDLALKSIAATFFVLGMVHQKEQTVL